MKFDKIQGFSGSVSEYVNDLGDLVGRIYAFDTPAREVIVVEVHDFDGDTDGKYDPVIAGLFADWDEAFERMERHLREAQAPDTVPLG
ncbi:hypothetical protein [Amycolatopsis sp. DSM 110486]|uniref:hypothetical protein n=1 Tax=Amycolatopsis sp. DSM 110486 TaxID=2865832 RepID=UPI001C6A706E|nr:hypothetical protein [Amycolatopsis sp. DSM 110486]QYN17485.1 hypothetical protein K1T34_32385 [Amycolatopsis sp. DSM 110486]